MQEIIAKEALKKIWVIVVGVMVGLVMVFVAVSIFVTSQYNRKYEEINEQVSDMTEQYLEVYLDEMSQKNMPVQQSEIKQVRDKIIVNLLSEDEKAKIISNVLGTLTPELYKNINFSSEAIRQDTLSQLENTLQEKTLEILNNSDLLTEEQKQLITKEITIAVETQILNTINEQYTEMTAAITTIEKYVENNLSQMQEMLSQYEEKLKALESEIAALKSKIDQSNLNSKSDTKDLKKQLDDMESEYSRLTNSFLSYINSMKETMDSLDLENGNLIDQINDLKASLELADDLLSASIKSLNSDLTSSSERLQEQITDNSNMISELDIVQKELQLYADAVKNGDEEARAKLQKKLEEYSKGLDDATRAHVNDVINSTTEDIDKKLANANQSISELEKKLTNSITANATAIEKDRSANVSDINEIIAELQKLISESETQNSTDQAKYEDALSQIAEKKDGVWIPRESTTPTKALSVYNTVINETKIENRITSVSETIDSTMMKAEFSADGSTLTITIPNEN